MKSGYNFLIILFSLYFFGCGEAPQQEKQIHLIDKNDPKLISAKKKALNSFDIFSTSFKKYKNDTTFFFSVKREFKNGERYEHMWVEVFEMNDNEIIGILGNEPGILKTFRLGDTLTFSKSEIEDWMIHDQKKDTILGAYTVRALGREDLLR